MQEKEIDGKAIWSYGNPEAEKVLIQLVGEQEILFGWVFACRIICSVGILPDRPFCGNCSRKLYAWLQECDIPCILEWNPGNHFREPEIRTAKAFAWLLEK